MSALRAHFSGDREKCGLILSKKLDMPDELWVRLRAEKDHELRAALICLLTAALAAQGTAAIVGESTGRLVLAATVVRMAGLGKTGT
jgi:hypothetical protein